MRAPITELESAAVLARMLTLTALLAMTVTPSVLLAQSDSTPPDTARVPWVTHRNLVAFGGAVVATVALRPLDATISDEFAEPHWTNNHRVRDVTHDVALLGGDGPFVASAALLAVSEAAHVDGLQRFAVHDMEAIAVATVITGLGKGIFGRALPGVDARHQFQWGRGFHDSNGPFVSFPSGHTAAAFALSATITGELEHAGYKRARTAGRLAFAAAGAVAVARVIQREHWPSDLPLAMAIGTWSGQAIQTHAGRPGKLGAVLRGLTAAPDFGHRERVGWTTQW